MAYLMASAGVVPPAAPEILADHDRRWPNVHAVDVTPSREPAAPHGPKLGPNEHLEADGSIRFIHAESGEVRWRLP